MGEKGSAHWGDRITQEAPRASAVRIRVPTLPGSCTSSKRRTMPEKVSGKARPGVLATAQRLWGVPAVERASMTLSATSTASQGKSVSPAYPSRTKTVSRDTPEDRASRTSLSPSTK